MQKEFKKYLFENCIKNDEKRILLAVSGGVDSMLMLQLFSEMKDLRISVAHCNYQLRGSESDADEQLVKEACNKYEFTLHHKSFDTHQYAKTNRLSVQMAARELRYNWFNELMREYHYDLLATAHHKNDVVETMLLNITRGTGIEGLHGIRNLRGNIIRPILFCSRSEIEAFAAKIGLKWREDRSNQKNDYARNKIRNKVIPVLKEINPTLEKTFIANAKHFNDAEVLLDIFIQEKERELVRIERDYKYISTTKLAKLDYANSFLSVYLSRYGFNDTVIADVIKNLNEQAGKLFYSNTHELLIDRNELILSACETACSSCAMAFENESLVHCDHFDLEISRLVLKNTDNEWNKGKEVACIGLENISFPLKIRPWEKGDVFKPLGMNGKKKVSDYLIDAKVNRKEKEKTMVLTSGNKIVWLIGHRIDERFKIKNSTKEILEIKMI